MWKKGKKYAQSRGICAYEYTFFIKLFVYLKKKVFLCTRFLIRNLFINILKVTIMSEIESKVKAIIVDKLGVDEAEVKAEASFTNDLGADSLDTVELIMEFEKEFSISIPDDKAEKIATVGDAIAYIEENAK